MEYKEITDELLDEILNLSKKDIEEFIKYEFETTEDFLNNVSVKNFIIKLTLTQCLCKISNNELDEILDSAMPKGFKNMLLELLNGGTSYNKLFLNDLLGSLLIELETANYDSYDLIDNFEKLQINEENIEDHLNFVIELVNSDEKRKNKLKDLYRILIYYLKDHFLSIIQKEFQVKKAIIRKLGLKSIDDLLKNMNYILDDTIKIFLQEVILFDYVFYKKPKLKEKLFKKEKKLLNYENT